jgi:hypothetical protein
MGTNGFITLQKYSSVIFLYQPEVKRSVVCEPIPLCPSTSVLIYVTGISFRNRLSGFCTGRLSKLVY